MAISVKFTEFRLDIALTFTFMCDLDLADSRSMYHWIAYHRKHTYRASDHEHIQSRTYDMTESVKFTEYRSEIALTFTFTCDLDLTNPRSMFIWIAHHQKHTYRV